MIFSETMIAAIARGEKTQTRRLFKEQEVKVRRRNRRTYTTRPFRPVVGKDYAVQPGRGQAERFRILCTAVRMEPLGQITAPDVRAEGFHRLDELARYWLTLHDKAFPPRERVFCPACLLDADFEYAADVTPNCRVCDGTEELKIKPRPTEAEVVERWSERWARVPVWVITFEHVALAPQRYLAAQPTRIEADYTTSPSAAVQDQVIDMGGRLRNAPVAAVEVDEIRAVPADERANAYDERVQLDRRLLDQEDRIRRAGLHAASNGTNVHSETRLINKLRAHDRADMDAIERAVQALEHKAQPRPSEEIAHAA